MKTTSFALAALLMIGCKDKAKDEPPPKPDPVVAKPEPEPKPAPEAPEAPSAKAPPALDGPTEKQKLGGFAGFSKDGTKFAWVAPGASGGQIYFLKIASVGAAEPEQSGIYPDESGQKEAKDKLAAFSPTRTAPPAGLKLAGDLTTTPPTLSLQHGDASVKVPIGEYPYPPTDSSEIWGVSEDGKHVAIHVGGPDVESALSKGGGKNFHAFFVVAIP